MQSLSQNNTLLHESLGTEISFEPQPITDNIPASKRTFGAHSLRFTLKKETHENKNKNFIAIYKFAICFFITKQLKIYLQVVA